MSKKENDILIDNHSQKSIKLAFVLYVDFEETF